MVTLNRIFRELSFSAPGVLPTEFRLFVRGWNPTEKGSFLFDDIAAKAVMSANKQWGVDRTIDLEHGMLSEQPSPDPTSRDARGWCKLELRSDGSLWCVGVKWTPDGAARLTDKRQRYVSPAFDIDPKTMRVTKLINIAITSIPATHATPALVAASSTKGARMDPKMVMKALEALIAGDAEGCQNILKGIIAGAAGAAPDADGEGGDGSAAEGGDDPNAQVSSETMDAADGDGGEASAEQPARDGREPPKPAGSSNQGGPPAKPSKASIAETAAGLATLMRLTGASTIGQAAAKVAVFHNSHVELETERQALSKQRATLESAERRTLCKELVRLGAEFPATVWADDKATTIKARWLKMPIADFRAHVGEQRKARGDKGPPQLRPPSGGDAGPGALVQLSATELAICKETGCDPTVYAALKSNRDSVVTGGK